MSSSTRAGGGPARSENDARRGAPPSRGLGRSERAPAAGSVTETVTLVVADAPPGVVATAGRAIDGTEAGTMAAKTLPCTAPGTPLTATPTSPPPAPLPRPSPRPPGTTAPAPGALVPCVR